MLAGGASSCLLVFFFFNDTATTEIYTLSLHDALPISALSMERFEKLATPPEAETVVAPDRSEEHTSELQSHVNLVCRLLLEKKKSGEGAPRRDRAGRVRVCAGRRAGADRRTCRRSRVG